MKRLLVVLLLAFAGTAFAEALTAEKLVLASAATQVDLAITSRKGIEIQNLGPNSIFCALQTSSLAVVNKARKIAAGESWSLALAPNIHVYCKAATADQVTGAATVVTEVR